MGAAPPSDPLLGGIPRTPSYQLKPKMKNVPAFEVFYGEYLVSGVGGIELRLNTKP